MAVSPARADIKETVRGAQDKLQALLRNAQVTNDPSAPVLEGLLDTVTAFYGMTADVGQQIETAKQPVRDEDLRRAVIQGVSGHATAIRRDLGWRNILIGGALLASALVVGAGCGYWFGSDAGYASGVRSVATFAELVPADAAAWTTIIRNNPSGREAVAACRSIAAQGGRSVCDLTIWAGTDQPPKK